MIVPIAAGIVAAVSKALTPPASLNMHGVTDRYLFDVDQHAKELEYLLSQGTTFINSVMEHEAAIPESVQGNTKKTGPKKVMPPPLPDTDEPLTLLGLDALYPPQSFEEVKVAYKQIVKKYHPDVILTPDSTEQERQKASAAFSRINAAFESLKKQQEAATTEYDVFENGPRVTRTADSPSYDNNSYPKDWERIRENEYYSRRNRMWHEEEYYYGKPIESQQAQRERQWAQRENDYIYTYDDYESHYEMDRRSHYQGGGPRDFVRQQGFPSVDRTSKNSFQNSRVHYTAPTDGFAYKDRLWNERQPFDAGQYRHQNYVYDQSDHGYHRFRDKWWNREHNEFESNLNGEFGP